MGMRNHQKSQHTNGNQARAKNLQLIEINMPVLKRKPGKFHIYTNWQVFSNLH